MPHHDLRERDAGSPRLEPPPDAARRETVLDRTVDRVDEPGHRFGDRFPDRRTEHREDRSRDLVRVASNRLADRCLDSRRERDGELPIARGALRDRLWQLLGELLRGELQRVEAPPELVELPALSAEEEVAELGELANAYVAGPVTAPGAGRAVVGHGSTLTVAFRYWSRVAADSRRHVREYAHQRRDVGLVVAERRDFTIEVRGHALRQTLDLGRCGAGLLHDVVADLGVGEAGELLELYVTFLERSQNLLDLAREQLELLGALRPLCSEALVQRLRLAFRVRVDVGELLREIRADRRLLAHDALLESLQSRLDGAHLPAKQDVANLVEALGRGVVRRQVGGAGRR